MSKFVFVLPERDDEKVMTRRLHFRVGKGSMQHTDVAGDTKETPQFEGQSDDEVEGTVRNMDPSGKLSKEVEFKFILEDGDEVQKLEIGKVTPTNTETKVSYNYKKKYSPDTPTKE